MIWAIGFQRERASTGTTPKNYGEKLFRSGKPMGSPSEGEGQMNIGILRGGNVGSALADAWLRHNHEVMIVTRQPLSWHGNARSGTLEEAVHFGGVVVLALPWQAAF